MSNDKAATAAPGIPDGWAVWRSDAGRYWATRDSSFPREAQKAGAARTVDGDDLIELARTIAEQESIAETL